MNIDVEKSAVIGSGVEFNGILTGAISVTVHGKFEGELRASSLEVGQTGRVLGTIFVDQADIHGAIENSIEVKNGITIRSTGIVSGNITYGYIVVEEGGIVSGSLIENAIDKTLDQTIGADIS